MAESGRAVDDKTRHAIELREQRLHATVRPAPPAARERHPGGIIVLAFEAVSGLWALAAGLLAIAGVSGLAPRSVTDDRLTVHLAIALAASATTALSALLYAIPRRVGGRLWSYALPWLHLLALNAAFILPAWRWHSTRLLPSADWTGTLVATTLLHLGWLVLLALNLGESFAPMMERPKTYLPEPLLPVAAAPTPPPASPASAGRPAVPGRPVPPVGASSTSVQAVKS